MKLQITMRKSNGVLVPADRYSEAEFQKVRENKAVIVTVHQARNPDHHAKFWAVAALVADNDDHFHDAEAAVEWAKIKTPWMIRSWKDDFGRIIVQTKSSDWASMDQLTFNKFYDRSIALWSERLGVDVETLELEAA